MNVVLKAIFTNGYVLIIPIIVWNIIFTSKLPTAYDPKSFNSGIPSFLIIFENIFRSVIFIFPLLFRFSINNTQGKIGLLIYIIGSFLYYASWLLLIYIPNSLWGKSMFGFTAPAYTPIIWLIGVGFMGNSCYFKIAYNKWHFIVPCIMFSIFHITHSVLVYFRSK